MSPELQAAIQRRAGGNPSGTLGQTTQTAPTFDPSIQQPSQPPQNPMPAPASTPSPPTGAGMGLPANSPESILCVKALDARLRSLSKIEEAQSGI